MLRLDSLVRSGLRPVSLELSFGGCLAITGPSGAGKTLLLRAIADLDPSEGEVFLEDRPRSAFSGPLWRQQVGYVPAEPAWWADEVEDHFADPAAGRSLAARLGLSDEVFDAPVARLSTGERQRLALARALILEPAVLLLDEPTAALDDASVAAVETVLRERLAESMAIVLITHDSEQAERLADRVLEMEAGRLGEPDAAP